MPCQTMNIFDFTIISISLINLFKFASSMNEVVSVSEIDPKGQIRRSALPNCPVGKGREGNAETLKSVQILNRHGFRAPVYEYPNDKYSNYDYGIQSGRNAQLTPKGKSQSFLLGRCIRQSYEDFLGNKYAPKKLFCQSADLERTRLTAQMILAGLFSPKENIPCTTLDSVVDNKILLTAPCPAYKAAKKEYKSTNPEAVIFLSKYQWLYIILTEKSGRPINDYDEVYELYDTIKTQHDQFKLDFPPWFSPLNSAMRENNDFYFYGSSATRKLQKLLIGPLLNEIVNNFNAVCNKMASSKVKMYLYSGHDTTIAPLANALGIYDRNAPPYFNAAIFLELHKVNLNYVIKVFYKNGVDQPMVEKFMPRCPPPCSFQKFKESLKDVLINDTDWNQLCASVNTEK